MPDTRSVKLTLKRNRRENAVVSSSYSYLLLNIIMDYACYFKPCPYLTCTDLVDVEGFSVGDVSEDFWHRDVFL